MCYLNMVPKRRWRCVEWGSGCVAGVWNCVEWGSSGVELFLIRYG